MEEKFIDQSQSTQQKIATDLHIFGQLLNII